AGGCRRRGGLPRVPRRGHGARPHPRRRRRLLAPRLMEPTDRNRRAWDEVHRRRAEIMAGVLGIPDLVRERLPDLTGKHVLHLQCATGESTAQLVELGALVTGVDISAEAVTVARERAPAAALVQADVHQLPVELRRGRFDLVYTGGGVLAWLQDLDAWAAGIG